MTMTTSIYINRLLKTIPIAALAAVLISACPGCTCKVNPEIHVQSVSVSPQSIDLLTGQTYSLTVSVLPDDAADKSVSWRSGNASIASVSNDGVVTAKSPGETVITAVTLDGGRSASCSVCVKDPVVEVSSVTLSQTSLTLTEGESATLSATLSPDNATDRSIRWSSSDPEVASVADGLVKALAAGTAAITVSSSNPDISASCLVTVISRIISVTGVTLDRSEAALLVGEKMTLTATVHPDDATDKTVVWTSSDEKVAKVGHGEVSALSQGRCTITATTAGGEFFSQCTVTVGTTSGVIPEIGWGE